MSRAKLVEMARRSLAHARAGTIDPADEVFRVPASHYHDPERWRLELERIFRRLPLVLGLSADLPEPGSYRALWVADTPILLTRTGAGEVRGFLNVCSHRGAVVVPEGEGRARRFSCPYHAWTYDLEGALVGIHKRDRFGAVDEAAHGLTALPVAERAGLIFGSVVPEAPIDVDTFLCGYDAMLAHHRFDQCTLVGRQEVAGPGWKVAYDGYLDLYHLPILHKATFGSRFPSDALYDAWGPHQRVSAPDPRLESLEAKPEAEWPTERLIGGVWTIFPHVSIADFDAGTKLTMVSQLFPGATPDESRTVQSFLAPEEPDAALQEKIEQMMAFLMHVVRDEDYATGIRIQKALKTGARSHVLFGRNEGGGQRFHRWVDAVIRTEDAGLAELFRRGPEPG